MPLKLVGPTERERERQRAEEEISGYLRMWRIKSMRTLQWIIVCDMSKRAFVRAHVEEEKAKRAFFSRFGTNFAFLLLVLFCVSDIF